MKTKLIAFVLVMISCNGFSQMRESRALEKGVSDEKAFSSLVEFVERNFSQVGREIIYINREKKKIEVTGSGPLTIYLFNKPLDGGEFRYRVTLSVALGRWEYHFTELYHKANPSSEAKIKDGGDLQNEKAVKGSGIFQKNWVRMQEQATGGRRELINNIDKLLQNITS